MKFRMVSLNGKIVLLTCLIAGFTALAYSGFGYSRLKTTTLDTAIEGLADETRLMSVQVKNAYRRVENDILTVSHMPPIYTLTDGADVTNLQSWHDDLAGVFIAIMHARPHYTQMRYIGIKDNGRELVRVNRTPTGTYTVPANELQEKSGEPYFQHALEEHDRDMFFSEVTYNIEHGKITEEKVSTLRAILPVYIAQDGLQGIIVINVSYAELLRLAFAEIVGRKDTFIINNLGDYMVFRNDGTISNLQVHDDYSTPPPAFLSSLLSSKISAGPLFESNKVSYFNLVQAQEDHPDAAVSVVVQVPRDELFQKADETRRDYLILSFVLFFAVLAVAAFASRWLTRSLKTLEREVRTSKTTNQPLKLSLTENDEIGELAKILQELTDGLARSEKRTQSIIDNIADGVITIDETGSIESYNPACEEIFGYSVSDVLGKDVSILMPETNAVNHSNYLKRYLKSGLKSFDWNQREENGRRKDGTEFPMEFTIRQVVSNNQILFVGIVRDITERKTIEKAKSEFISTVSHELRTPLTSIKGALGLIKIGAPDALSDKLQSVLNIADRNCDRLVLLTNEILDIEKLEAGKMQFVMQPTDMSALLEDAVAANESYGKEYGVTFTCTGTDEPVIVNADPQRLMQVMANLLSNAAKFSPRGVGHVEVSLTRVDEGVRVSVKDNGCGIPVEARETIFEKFTQADSSDQRQQGGTGLGLSIAKMIVEEHGGSIDFTTETGKGTTFFFDLP